MLQRNRVGGTSGTMHICCREIGWGGDIWDNAHILQRNRVGGDIWDNAHMLQRNRWGGHLGQCTYVALKTLLKRC